MIKILLALLLSCVASAQIVTYYTIAPGPNQIPAATSGNNNQRYIVRDGISAVDCTNGGGNYVNTCQSNGTTYAIAGGTGGATYTATPPIVITSNVISCPTCSAGISVVTATSPCVVLTNGSSTPNVALQTPLSVGCGGTGLTTTPAGLTSSNTATATVTGTYPNQVITVATPPSGITGITGDASSSGSSGTVNLTLATVNGTPGTCGDATHIGAQTTNAKGLVTGCTTYTVSATGGITGLTGDGTTSGTTGSVPFTLATVNSAPGVCGDATHIGATTINGKGLVTSCTVFAVAAATGVNATSIYSLPITAALGAGQAYYSPTGTNIVPYTPSAITNGYGNAIYTNAGLTYIAKSAASRAITATTGAILPSDCGNNVTVQNASAVAIGLPQANVSGSFNVGCEVTITNYGAGAATVTASVSYVGPASLTIYARVIPGATLSGSGSTFHSCTFVSSASNTYTLSGNTINDYDLKNCN